MMVALIERDHGRQLAAAVGDWFLHTHIREGFGPQRMDLRYRLGVADEKLLAVLRAMETSIETPQPRAALARQAGISLRQLERLFHRHIGHGIHSHYRWLRLAAGAPAVARDHSACARRGAGYRLCLIEPIRAGLFASIW